MPIFLNADAMRVLIVGAGPVGCRRARTFLDAGVADVLIVALEPRGELPTEATFVKETFADGHLDGRNLAVAAADDQAVNAAVAEAARRRGVLCVRADDAALGDAIVPAVATVGPIVAAVSAGSPALSKLARERVEAALRPLVALAEATRSLRPQILADAPNERLRAAALRDLASEEAVDRASSDGASLRAWIEQRHPWMQPDRGKAT